jgi:hypothetical protein
MTAPGPVSAAPPAAAVVPLPSAQLDPRQALRVALFWLGTIALVATVLLVREPLWGAMAAVLAVAALAPVLIGAPRWQERRWWPHAVAAVLAAISAFGLCASHCGGYVLYASMLGLPTAVAALLLHGLLVAILRTERWWQARTPWLGDAAIASACGASGFFLSVMLATGAWCSACAGIHALMAVQAVDLLHARRGPARVAAVALLLAAAGAVNALYHHRAAIIVGDDSQELLSYLRSAWTAPDPPQQVVPLAPDPAAVRRDGQAVAQQLGLGDPARPAAAVPLAPPTPPAPAGLLDADHPPVLRPLAEADRWGADTAPIVLFISLDPGCPVCAQQFRQLLELEDLVEAHRLQVRFLLSYRQDASQAAASLAYLAGLIDERLLITALTAFYDHQHDLLLAADALAVLPPALPPTQAVALLRQHQGDISALLADARRTSERLGGTGEPALWLLAAGTSTPLRRFQGLTMAPILRLAVASLAGALPGPP